MTEILELCTRQGILLFVDECFLDLCENGESLKPHLTGNPNLFLLKAFTKSYGMAGLRLGYCLCSDSALLHRMSQTVQPWNISTPAQAAGIAALKEREFLQRSKALIREERGWLKNELEKAGLPVCDSEANYLLFLGPGFLSEKLREKGISIRDCSNYHGLGRGWYRIAVRTHEENAVLIDGIRSAIRED